MWNFLQRQTSALDPLDRKVSVDNQDLGSLSEYCVHITSELKHLMLTFL